MGRRTSSKVSCKNPCGPHRCLAWVFGIACHWENVAFFSVACCGHCLRRHLPSLPATPRSARCPSRCSGGI